MDFFNMLFLILVYLYKSLSYIMRSCVNYSLGAVAGMRLLTIIINP